MVATYPADAPALTYSIPKSAYRGTRVVVQATYKRKLDTPYGSALFKVYSVDDPAAVQCTFVADQIESFAWLAPKKMADRYPLPRPSLPE